MRKRSFCGVMMVTCLLAVRVDAQNGAQFQSRSGGARDVAQRGTSVSADLLAIYEKTKAADTETDVTAIARACSKVIPEAARSKADRDYASSLLAWALNRRGELRSDQAAKMIELGKLAEADQLDSQAAEDFETAIKYNAGNWRTHHNLAISLAMKGNYPRSIGEFSKAIELNPDYANSYFNRGEMYFELEQYSKAISDYSRALDLNAADPQFYNSRGHCRFLLESYDDAVADYRQAAQLGSDSAVFHTDLADAYQFLGEWEKAAQVYREAIAANNRYPRAYQNAAWLMATCPEPSLRNDELALAAAKRAIELSGERSARSLETLAAATASVGKHAEAAKLQSEAMAMITDAEERQEFAQRLGLYQKGQAYRQPKPISTLAIKSDLEDSRIRTASGSERSSR